MKIEKFEDIIAWQKGKELTINIYVGFKNCKDFSFKNQIERPEAVRPVAGSGASEEIHPMLTQKLASSFQTPTVNTEHTLENITKSGSANENTGNNSEIKTPKIDPYREIPE